MIFHQSLHFDINPDSPARMPSSRSPRFPGNFPQARPYPSHLTATTALEKHHPSPIHLLGSSSAKMRKALFYFISISRLALVGISLNLFLLACTEHVVDLSPNGSSYYGGAMCLALGWFHIFGGFFAWLANPICSFFIGYILYSTWKPPTRWLPRQYYILCILAIFALLLAHHPNIENIKPLGGSNLCCIYKEGYHHWLLSVQLICIATLIPIKRTSIPTPPAIPAPPQLPPPLPNQSLE